jgi:hypothetical protein
MESEDEENRELNSEEYDEDYEEVYEEDEEEGSAEDEGNYAVHFLAYAETLKVRIFHIFLSFSGTWERKVQIETLFGGSIKIQRR